ncbi:SOS response-associated peptidase [Acetobacterium wieringae]|nr:SOS response-associated peptidase family protein [Acetobacterium wieringae]URN84530.1 SOS response-associated peptidase [Acetobacterium wieringae]
MCGRYILYSEKEESAIKAIVEEVNKKHHGAIKKGDIYPTDLAPVYVSGPDKQGTALRLLKWGYNRHYQKKTLLINARSETVLEKVAFRDDFIKQRCLIPAVGFYEWNEKKSSFVLPVVMSFSISGAFFIARQRALMSF